MSRRCPLFWAAFSLFGLALAAARLPAQDAPPWMPRYDLDVHLHLDEHRVTVRQQVTWINTRKRPAADLVFNAHSHYKIPAGEVGVLAKTVELLRVNPGESLDLIGHPCEVTKATLVPTPVCAVTGGVRPPPARSPAKKADDGADLPQPRKFLPDPLPPAPAPFAPVDLAYHYS